MNDNRSSDPLHTNQPSGIFTWILSTDTVHCDGLAADLFGFLASDVEFGLPIKKFLDRIHPDDLPVIAKAIRDAILTGEPYQEEYRICRPDGSVVEVMALGSCFRDASGEPSHYAGMIVPLEPEESSDGSLLDLCLKAYGVAERSGRLSAAGKIMEIISDIGLGDEFEDNYRVAYARH